MLDHNYQTHQQLFALNLISNNIKTSTSYEELSSSLSMSSNSQAQAQKLLAHNLMFQCQAHSQKPKFKDFA